MMLRVTWLILLLFMIAVHPTIAFDSPANTENFIEEGQKLRSKCMAALSTQYRNVHHKPDADVIYQSGTTRRGAMVPPADLNARLDIKTTLIVIPITLNIADQLGFAIGDGLSADAIVGFLSLHGSNVYFNGQSLNNDQNAALFDYCQQLEMQEKE